MDDTKSTTTETISGIIELQEKPSEAKGRGIDSHTFETCEKRLIRMLRSHLKFDKSLSDSRNSWLKNLINQQLEFSVFELMLYDEFYKLEVRYNKEYQQLHKKRQDIINGVMESKAKKIEDFDETKEETKEKNGFDENTKGIPDFWLKVLKNGHFLNSLIKEHDEPILKYLTDIQVTLHEVEDMGFTLHFFFAENDYFSNPVLTNKFIMKSIPQLHHPFHGPQIIKCLGCTIDWKKDKEKSGKEELVTTPVKNDSFFNFFSTPEIKDVEEDEFTTYNPPPIIHHGFEIGQLLKDWLIPDAYLYYHGTFPRYTKGHQLKVRSMNDKKGLPNMVTNSHEALKQLQMDILKLKVWFYDERHRIEVNFSNLQQKLYDNRQKTINKEEAKDESAGENKKALPGFWLRVLVNTDPFHLLNHFVQEHDVPILKCLEDIQVKLHGDEDMGFTLEFFFAKNDYFTNVVLTKKLIMKNIYHLDYPFNGPRITERHGCPIDWKEGKNITSETVTRTQKGKSGEEETVIETIKRDSFFNFFSLSQGAEDVPESHSVKDMVALTLKEETIPMAILHFIKSIFYDRNQMKSMFLERKGFVHDWEPDKAGKEPVKDDPGCKPPKEKCYSLAEDKEDPVCKPPKEKHCCLSEVPLNKELICPNLIKEDDKEKCEATSSKDNFDIGHVQKDKMTCYVHSSVFKDNEESEKILSTCAQQALGRFENYSSHLISSYHHQS